MTDLPVNRKGVGRLTGVIGRMLFPPTCVICGMDGDAGQDMCDGCRQSLSVIDVACTRCGLPMAGDPEASLICGRCIRKPPYFDRTYCGFEYREPADWLVQQLKFNAKLSHARVLAGLLAERLAASLEHMPDALLPVPLHRRRLYQRGFNQALEIARPLAKQFKLPLAYGLCRRSVDTTEQSALPAKKRATNVRAAFTLHGELPGKHVAIVDDVMTTGATVNEIARLLKRNGAESVQVWVVARAVLSKL